LEQRLRSHGWAKLGQAVQPSQGFNPVLHLMKRGFVLDRPAPGKRIVYTSLSGHGVNSLYWVYFKKCDAAALGDDDLEKVSPKLQAALRVIEPTKPYPGFLVLMSPTLSDAGRKTFVDFLASMHRDRDGQALLHGAYACERLEPVRPSTAAWIEEADAGIRALVGGRAP
jgi:ABC-type phosphate/phosphonate transport system substrate-binding protein